MKSSSDHNQYLPENVAFLCRYILSQIS